MEKSKKTILVVDDEPSLQRVLEIALQKAGYDVLLAQNGEEAWNKLTNSKVDLILSDLKMPKLDGLGLLKQIKKAKLSVPFILMSAHGTIELAVEAMKLGANDYLIKPFDHEEVEILIQKTFETEQLKRENQLLRETVEEQLDNILGFSPAIHEILKVVEKAAPTPSTVLLTGETGTGKEVLARFIHQHSLQKKEVFVALNCSAIPDTLLESELFGYEKGAFTGADREKAGKLELADGGTLFLDEIGDMSLTLQAKLLRVLEEKTFMRVGGTRPVRVEFRLIAATNKNLEKMIEEKHFRSDLYYRLRVISVHLPPLRERKEDIPYFASFFLDKYALQLGKNIERMTPEVMQRLCQYAWPGNIRELENVIERATVLCHACELTADLLPQELHRAPLEKQSTASALDFERAIQQKEAELIRQALKQVNGVKAQAAKCLGMSERNFWYKLKKYGIES